MTMNAKEREEFATLFAHVEDLALRAEQGSLTYSAFLTPRELHYAEVHLRHINAPYRSFGGYAEAERCWLYLLPSYMEELAETEKAEIGRAHV